MSYLDLDPNDAHIYLLFPEKADKELREQYRDLLNAEEETRYNNLKNQKVRDQYLLTRGLVRTKLSLYLGMKPNELSFSYNEHEKPELVINANQPKIRFNISHTDGLIALAVTLENDIGIDIENRTRKNATIEIAHRFFSPREVKNLREAPEEEQKDHFFDFWTLKESYIKARGTGLTLSLTKFGFSFEKTYPEISFEPELKDDSSQWSFRLYSPTEKHRLAVGVKTASLSTIHFITIPARKGIPSKAT